MVCIIKADGEYFSRARHRGQQCDRAQSLAVPFKRSGTIRLHGIPSGNKRLRGPVKRQSMDFVICNQTEMGAIGVFISCQFHSLFPFLHGSNHRVQHAPLHGQKIVQCRFI